MRTLEYCPNAADISRRSAMKKFGSVDTPAPSAQEPLPFKLGCTEPTKEVATGTYKAPVIVPTGTQSYTTVKVFNLPLTLTRREFEAFLAGHTRAAVSTLTFVTDREKRTFRGFAFCSFADAEVASSFIKDIDGRVIDNYKIGAMIVRR